MPPLVAITFNKCNGYRLLANMPTLMPQGNVNRLDSSRWPPQALENSLPECTALTHGSQAEATVAGGGQMGWRTLQCALLQATYKPPSSGGGNPHPPKRLHGRQQRKLGGCASKQNRMECKFRGRHSTLRTSMCRLRGRRNTFAHFLALPKFSGRGSPNEGGCTLPAAALFAMSTTPLPVNRPQFVQLCVKAVP